MGTIVSGRGVAHAWIDSWNRHDSAAVAANLTEQGTYADPATGGPQGRGDLAAYAEVYFEAFPDLRFEIVRIVDGGGAVVVQWWCGARSPVGWVSSSPTVRSSPCPAWMLSSSTVTT
jgi:predicted ester cyclase